MTQLNSASSIWRGIAAKFLRSFIGIWGVIKANYSEFLYVKLLFWLLTTMMSFLPFVLAERWISNFSITFEELYLKNYESVLSVFVAMIAVTVFDMLAAFRYSLKNNSLTSASSITVVAVLLFLEMLFTLELGSAITMQSVSKVQPVSINKLSSGFLTFTAFVCFITTGFAAFLSNEYQPKGAAAPKSRK